jgi:hypothetical protein
MDIGRVSREKQEEEEEEEERKNSEREREKQAKQNWLCLMMIDKDYLE